jgi:predicted dehydrogenase
MDSRRDFLMAAGLGAVSTLAFTSSSSAQQPTVEPWDPGTGKKVRVGIIGAENSHSRNFGRVFNIENRFPGVKAVAIWGETDAFAEFSAKEGQIPKIVKRQEELLGLIDALIIDHRHAKYHVEAARPFIEAGIPLFMDKPFSYRYAEGRDLLELARTNGTPVTSMSTAGYGPIVDDVAAQVRGLDEIFSIVTTGRSDIHSKYGGVFFYGIHVVERLFKVFGDEVEMVRATRHGSHTTAQFKYLNGHLATAILEKGYKSNIRELYCVTPQGMIEIAPRIDVDNSMYCYADIVRMFQTGWEPRTHDAILRPIAALEAIERSIQTEDWERLPS